MNMVLGILRSVLVSRFVIEEFELLCYYKFVIIISGKGLVFIIIEFVKTNLSLNFKFMIIFMFYENGSSII